MSWTNLLGIYPDTIEKVFDVCHNTLQTVRTFVNKIGYDSDAEYLDFNLHEEVIAELDDIGMNPNKITTSLVAACLNTTSRFLNNTEIFRDLGLAMEGFTNRGYDYELNIIEYGSECAYESDKIEQLLYEKFADCLFNAIFNQILDENRNIPEGNVLEQIIINGLKNGEYAAADILACFKDFEVKGAFRKLVDNYPVSPEQAETEKPIKEEQADIFEFEF